MVDNKCTVEDCELERYGEYDECILHCDKDNFKTLDLMKDEFINVCQNLDRFCCIEFPEHLDIDFIFTKKIKKSILKDVFFMKKLN